jgi:hypothetical protein
MEILGPAPDSLNNDQIVAQYDSALTQMIKASADSQYEFERQVLVNQARLNWQFVKGNHFSVPGDVSSSYGQITDYVPFDGGSGDENGADVKLCPPLNLIGGDLYKFMAVMGQTAPRVKAVADNPQDPDSIACAQSADVNVRDLWAKNKIDRKWKALAFHQYVTGPIFLRGFWNTDAKRYGQTEEPKVEVQAGPDGSPMPVVIGQETYANGDAELELFSVLDVSIPYEAAELRGNPLRLERMRSKWALLDRYKGADGGPGPLDKYRDGDVPDDDYSASSTTAAEAKDSVTNPSGTGRARKGNQWRHVEYWIPPHLYNAVVNTTARTLFQTQFPSGLYIARVGSVTVEIDHRAVEEEWAVCRVGRGEKIMDRPIGSDAIPISQAIDDLFGMAIETVLRAITQTIMDMQLIDRAAMSTKEGIPGEIIPTALPVDGDLAKRIYQIPPARLGDQVLPLLQTARAFMQDITGIRPEIAGGGQPTQTYREAKQRRDQALMQLSPQADEMRFASEEIAEILVKLRSKYGAGTVTAQRKGAYGMETDIADMAQLKESGWHAESNDDFPMTLADRRDAVFSLLKDFSPEVQQALSVLDPLNIEEIFELIQVPGFESAVRDQKEKTLCDIRQLLDEQPIQGNPGPDGAPAPPQPSMPPDPFDNHAVVAGIVAKWMISKTGQQAKNRQPAGFANVQAFQAAHEALAAPPPPPPPPPLKGAVSWAGKLEDFPNLVPEILQGAGLPAPGGQPPAPAPPGPGDMGAPAPVVPSAPGGPSPVQQASPLPPLPANGAPTLPVQ